MRWQNMAFWNGVIDKLQGWLPAWLVACILFIVIVSIGFVLQRVLIAWLSKRAAAWHPMLQSVFIRTRRLGRYAIVLFALVLAVPLAPLTRDAELSVHHIFIALFIVLLGWIALAAANLFIDHYVHGLQLDAADNLMARKAATQMRIFRQATSVFLVLLTAAFALMSFDGVRQFGISLFASAGVAGIVAGLAARPMLENLIAGVQLALTQPVRLEDAVVIAGEWGWVEEINSTYIVVRLWDWRRLVVPLSYLFANPFTNWTRSSASIIGSVFVYADYTLPMDAVRAKAEEIVKASRLWDGQVVNVQVSDAREQAIEIRVLCSAADSPRAWDLRCEVREKLIAFIRDNFPESLPRVRRQDFRLQESGRGDGPMPRPHRPV
ncbi:MAG TPA: mechanosensitive ion channel family protein [Rhizomicrobium sp.]|jgi:small-conductance mechanosensitive channel|nr:mechanosensitive ion channel family protein [Rhizomicrobium sp.]